MTTADGHPVTSLNLTECRGVWGVSASAHVGVLFSPVIVLLLVPQLSLFSVFVLTTSTRTSAYPGIVSNETPSLGESHQVRASTGLPEALNCGLDVYEVQCG